MVNPSGCHLAPIFICLPPCRLTHFPWGNGPDTSISTTAAKEAFGPILAYLLLRNVLKSVPKAFSQIQGIECSKMTEQCKTENKSEGERKWGFGIYWPISIAILTRKTESPGVWTMMVSGGSRWVSGGQYKARKKHRLVTGCKTQTLVAT